jgi:hypothetical protein
MFSFDCCLGRCLQSDPARQGPPADGVVRGQTSVGGIPCNQPFDVEITTWI